MLIFVRDCLLFIGLLISVGLFETLSSKYDVVDFSLVRVGAVLTTSTSDGLPVEKLEMSVGLVDIVFPCDIIGSGDALSERVVFVPLSVCDNMSASVNDNGVVERITLSGIIGILFVSTTGVSFLIVLFTDSSIVCLL